MAYQTYTTDALVCGSYLSNTSDKSFMLFTEEFGMLYATARSVREERSRQRYALQDFSRVRISLVKGKGGWRIGSVTAQENYFLQASAREARTSVVRIHRLLRRLVRGEESMPTLYRLVIEGLGVVSTEAVLEPEFFTNVVSVRILHTLGHIDPRSIPDQILHTPLREVAKMCANDQTTDLDQICQEAVAISQL